tara:strand:- start:486 stop:1328 length:843 start_codon:yes stop_codon:yes gene_type:complete
MEALDLIDFCSKKLKENNISTHKLDSELLLSEVLNKTREEILTDLHQKVYRDQIGKYYNFVNRRSSKEPIAYILQNKEFWSKNFIVSPYTLIPRPETELLVEKIVEIFKKRSLFILDVGTGTGCILLSLISELKNSKGIGIDISKKAIEIAKKNQKTLDLSDNTKFYCRSVMEMNNYKFDLIVSNPPYIRTRDLRNLVDDVKNFEPKLALDGGNDGLDVMRKVIYKSSNILKINGTLALEIGFGQFKQVSKILKKHNFKIRYLIKDYRDNVRCILSTLRK